MRKTKLNAGGQKAESGDATEVPEEKDSRASWNLAGKPSLMVKYKIIEID